MDDLVEQALAKWPNVPAISGWLKLDSRGNWLLTGPVPEGLSITNKRILNFIARNYACDAQGRYYFQNGPQKAYVTLEYTPWIYRVYQLVNGCFMLASHTGLVCLPTGCWTDAEGRILIATDLGLGLLHSSDTNLFCGALEPSDSGDSSYIHRAAWCVPDQPAQIINTDITLRLPKGLSPTTQESALLIKQSSLDELIAQYPFVREPIV